MSTKKIKAFSLIFLLDIIFVQARKLVTSI